MLLILAGVALATLTGQGNIIGNAENAVGKYNNSVTAEQQLLNEIEKQFQNYLEEENTEPTEPEIVNSTDIANNPEKHFGGYVTNYTTPSGDPNVKWRIFYADESNIYLIASDYIHYDYTPRSQNYGLSTRNNNDYWLAFDNVYKDYNGAINITNPSITKWLDYVNKNTEAEQISIKAVAFMLDIDIWNTKYKNEKFAEYAIGGPTLELLCASYKEMNRNKYIEYIYDDRGYKIKWNTDDNYAYSITDVNDNDNLYYLKDDLGKCSYQWLASPNANSGYGLLTSGTTKKIIGIRCEYGSNSVGLRPIICLKSGIQLEKISNTEYRIVE